MHEHFSCVELTSFSSILLKLFSLFLLWIPLASTSSISTPLCLHLQGILLPALLAFFWVFCIFTSFESPAAVGLVKKGSKILANNVSREKNDQNTLEIWVELFLTHKGSYFDFSVLNTSGLLEHESPPLQSEVAKQIQIPVAVWLKDW